MAALIALPLTAGLALPSAAGAAPLPPQTAVQTLIQQLTVFVDELEASPFAKTRIGQALIQGVDATIAFLDKFEPASSGGAGGGSGGTGSGGDSGSGGTGSGSGSGSGSGNGSGTGSGSGSGAGTG
ncbi:MAG: hypothetical protein ABSB73_06670 [Solirubrobacteraceae bacterium]